MMYCTLIDFTFNVPTRKALEGDGGCVHCPAKGKGRCTHWKGDRQCHAETITEAAARAVKERRERNGDK